MRTIMRLYLENKNGDKRDSITLPIVGGELSGLIDRLDHAFDKDDCFIVDYKSDFTVGTESLQDLDLLIETSQRVSRLTADEYDSLQNFCVEFELRFEDIGGLFDYVNQIMRKRRTKNEQ